MSRPVLWNVKRTFPRTAYFIVGESPIYTTKGYIVNETTKVPTIAFDYPRFYAGIDALREHHGIENQNKLALAIGVSHSALSRLRDGKPVEFETMLKIVAWSKLDLRQYLSSVPTAQS